MQLRKMALIIFGILCLLYTGFSLLVVIASASTDTALLGIDLSDQFTLVFVVFACVFALLAGWLLVGARSSQLSSLDEPSSWIGAEIAMMVGSVAILMWSLNLPGISALNGILVGVALLFLAISSYVLVRGIPLPRREK
jgi:hypothetical protein